MTIFALSTIEGQSGVAIIRVSGPESKKTIKKITGLNVKPRYATLATIKTLKGKNIDEGIVIYFPKNKSFTGEEVAEFHVHGSPAIIELLLKELSKIKGLRPAEGGEFTKQAYINGKLNILQVEGLSNLIKSETENQRKQALKNYFNESSKIYFSWLESLRTALALIEASIDFSDEEIPTTLIKDSNKIIKELRAKIIKHEKTFKQSKLIKEGLKVVILGIPNSGKSTLINYLSKKEIAIVSSKAGTTRDLLTQRVDFNGMPVTFYDTAGLRKAKNNIEKEGNKRAYNAAKDADIRIYLGSNNLIEPFKGIKIENNPQDIKVINKSDLKKKHKEKPNITISLKKSFGLDRLKAKIDQKIKELANQHIGPVVSSDREHQHIVNALGFLAEVNYKDPSIASEQIRQAIKEIASISKKTNNEEILDIIFNEFCIGK